MSDSSENSSSSDEDDLYVNAAAVYRAKKVAQTKKNLKAVETGLKDVDSDTEDNTPNSSPQQQATNGQNGNCDEDSSDPESNPSLDSDDDDGDTLPKSKSSEDEANNEPEAKKARKVAPCPANNAVPVRINDVVDLCLESEGASSDLEIVSEKAGNSDNVKRMHSTGSMDLSFSFNGEEDEDYSVDVKIRWKFQGVKKYAMLRNEPFLAIFEQFAKEEGVDVSQIRLLLNEVPLKTTDTPASKNISVIDVIEAGVSKKVVEEALPPPVEEENTCTIKVQTGPKNFILSIIRMDESFASVYAKCAKENNCPESNVKLLFDGEEVDRNDTPESLDIEDEACFDLRIKP